MKPSRKAELIADTLDPDVMETPEESLTPAEEEVTTAGIPFPPPRQPSPLALSPLETVQLVLDEMSVSDLKTVVEQAEGLIHELQRAEVEALESQMRAIQDQLIALKGPVAQSGGRNLKPLRNPENPSEYYVCGLVPQWLRDLVARTGKPIWQLRDESL